METVQICIDGVWIESELVDGDTCYEHAFRGEILLSEPRMIGTVPTRITAPAQFAEAERLETRFFIALGSLFVDGTETFGIAIVGLFRIVRLEIRFFLFRHCNRLSYLQKKRTPLEGARLSGAPGPAR